MGFKPLAGATDYIYDVNGNMTTDPHKGLTITYNHPLAQGLFTEKSTRWFNVSDLNRISA